MGRNSYFPFYTPKRLAAALHSVDVRKEPVGVDEYLMIPLSEKT
jgi:hypothetical protein